MHSHREDHRMIPVMDLKTQYQSIRQQVREAVDSVLESGAYILGPEVAAFESEFAAYCGTRHAIAVNSGTSALHLSLLACGVGPGDEVITVPATFIATVAAIRYTGARPVLVDIDPISYTIDPKALEAAITPRTKVILPVHLYGQPAAMHAILEIASRRGITVIEDAAQAHGATFQGRRVGSFGRFGCFSFYPTKNLGACGEGGLITTSDDAGAKQLRMLRDWGQEIKNEHVIEGYNNRLEGIQAAILRVKMGHLEEWTELRRAHARHYNEHLPGSGVVLPKELAGNRHVYHLYPVLVEDRTNFQKALLESGVQTAVHYPTPAHLQKAHADLGYKRGDFPVAERLSDSELSLPMYPELTQAQLDTVVSAVKAARPLEAVTR
jgi:dTDP-4-amino-4,6-dideoxygalactose transaminase